MRLPDSTISVQLRELYEGDAERLHRTYQFLRQVREHVGTHRRDGDDVERLAALVDRLGLQRVRDDIAALGRGMRRSELSPRLHKAYHDIRGGSLLALLVHLELVQQGCGEREDVMRASVLARDHLKIMRNAVPDLDPAQYAADLSVKEHPIALLREKWGAVSYWISGREVAVGLDCPFEGSIASCCMELSTLDRIIYNLVDNAAEHTHDGRVRLSVLPLTGPGEGSKERPHGGITMLRVAAINRLDVHQRDTLQRRFGTDLGALFQGGFTTHGHGLGLRICADLVTHAAGVPTVALAVDRGHLGVRIIDDWFVAWFLWPAVAAGAKHQA